jgi:hypothetical protein
MNPPTAELELLLLCARTRVDDEFAQRLSSIAERGIDWNSFIVLAHRHGVVALVYRTLCNQSPNPLPAEAFAKLRSLAESIRVRNMVMIGTLHGILRALDAAGITAVPYKGPALAAFLFQDFSIRQFADLDLLVRPCDALAARRVLLKQGYVPTRRIPDYAAPAYVRLHGEFSFLSGNQILVELNWRIAARYWRFPEIPDSAWQKLGRLTLAGVSVPWFAPEHVLLVISLHGSKHRWEMLKWIVDVAELLRVCPDLDWDKVMLDARQGGYERMLALGLYLANDLLDAPLPPGVRDAVRRKPLVESLAAEVCDNLFDPHAKPSTTLAELAFLARATERLNTKLFCLALRPLFFLLHRIIRPAIAAVRRTAAS